MSSNTNKNGENFFKSSFLALRGQTLKNSPPNFQKSMEEKESLSN